MFISDKFALYRFLNNYVGSNNAVLFLRTGSSDDVPQTLRELAASSVAAIQMLYKGQTTGSDNFLRRQFYRGRSYQPLGGYAQRRTYTVNGQQIQTQQVVPEKVNADMGSVAYTPEQWALRANIFGDHQTSFMPTIVPNTYTVLDFGRTLRFRGLTVYAGSQLGADGTISYSSDGVTWTVAQTGLNNGEYQFDFTGRYVRVQFRATGAAFNSYCVMQFWAERGTEFAARPITHGVLVPNITSASYSTIMDTSKMDYLGLVLDVGQDIKLDVAQTGKFGHVNVQDWLIPIKSPSKQGA